MNNTAHSPAATATPAAQGFGVTARRDNWWIGPLLTVCGLLAFIVYSTWAALQGKNYFYGPYLSPFYSPEIFGTSPHALCGPLPSWFPWPSWLPFSPAFLILWAPGGFRLTCYYYRKAYYRSFWADPPACMVGEPRNVYRGENSLPLILQNVHRYFLYLAILFIGLLAYDGACSYIWTNPDGSKSFGMGLGSVVLTLNPILLGAYTFGCHSLRHLIGGKVDCFSCAQFGEARYKAWSFVSFLNRYHMQMAWCSLFMVGFSDVYVRMVAMGIWRDPRFF